MKTFFYSIIVVVSSFISSNIYSQNIFLGTWEYQEGNEIFRVHLFEDSELGLVGHYEMIQTVNGLETTLYTSKKFIDSNGFWPLYVIFGEAGDNEFVGAIYDNTVNANLYHPEKRGSLIIEILTNSGGFNPTITAHWKVERKKYQGLIINEAPEFSVPTDIILTKVN